MGEILQASSYYGNQDLLLLCHIIRIISQATRYSATALEQEHEGKRLTEQPALPISFSLIVLPIRYSTVQHVCMYVVDHPSRGEECMASFNE
jgi:hypothetical protein